MILHLTQKWEDDNRRIRETMEKLFEAAGIIAYAATETSIVFIMANGSLLKIEGFFYPEGGFMQINGEFLPILET